MFLFFIKMFKRVLLWRAERKSKLTVFLKEKDKNTLPTY